MGATGISAPWTETINGGIPLRPHAAGRLGGLAECGELRRRGELRHGRRLRCGSGLRGQDRRRLGSVWIGRLAASRCVSGSYYGVSCPAAGVCTAVGQRDQTAVVAGTGSRALTVARAGNGSGTVKGGEIDCPGTCSRVYPSGTSVTLTAVPDTGAEFSGWTGDCADSSVCTVVLSSDRSVTATFALSPTPTRRPPRLLLRRRPRRRLRPRHRRPSHHQRRRAPPEPSRSRAARRPLRPAPARSSGGPRPAPACAARSAPASSSRS